MNEDAQFETTLYPQVNFEVFEDSSCSYCSWVNVWCHSTVCKPYLLPLAGQATVYRKTEQLLLPYNRRREN